MNSSSLHLLNERLLNLLKQIDTPTVCNSIEMIQGKRGFANFTRQTVQIANLNLPPMVGWAQTARIRGKQPPTDIPNKVKQRRMDYYKYISQGKRPAICVIQDLDFPDATGAFWGEINTRVHRSFGIEGALTNGVMRDLGDLDPNFQVIAGSIGPSHGFVHVIDYDQPVCLFDLNIKPGDLIHADRHGAVVISKEIITHLEQSINRLVSAEKIILDATKKKKFNFDEFKKAWEAYDRARV